MNCSQVRHTLFPTPEKALVTTETPGAMGHLRDCQVCQAFFEQQRELSTSIRSKVGTEPAPEALRERMAHLVETHRAAVLHFPAPPSLEERVLGARRAWWRLLLGGYIRVPVPIACSLIVLMAAGAWRWAKPVPPRVLVKTERVEVPVVRDRVVTKFVYRNGPAPVHTREHGLTFHELKPVTELRPRIIRGGNDQD
jgi:hypothetical protein